jgi:hypothetical protein
LQKLTTKIVPLNRRIATKAIGEAIGSFVVAQGAALSVDQVSAM